MSNLIVCDGCGEQIEGEDALQCVGCLKYFCRNCASDIGTGVDIMHGLCKQCEKWGGEVLADCEQRKQELVVAKIKAAMAILEQSPCGAVGKFGFSRTALKRDINMPDPNMQYHVDQTAWLELNELLEAITNA